jgi:hypothetical protein
MEYVGHSVMLLSFRSLTNVLDGIGKISQKPGC